MVAQYLAWKNIVKNIERSLFPVLGILLGTASMIAIMSLSAGGKSIIERDLAHIGENNIIIKGERATLRDMEYLESLNFVKYVVPIEGKFTDKNTELTVYALSSQGRESRGIKGQLRTGEIFLEKSAKERIGDSTIQVNLWGIKQWVKVSGEYEDKNKNEFSGIVDFTTVREQLERGIFSNGIGVVVKGGGDRKELEELITTALNRYNPQGKYEVIEEQVHSIASRIKKNLSKILATLGGTVVFLGGLGISNLMASMIQRRKGEIGMLMAIGAKRGFVFQMFLTEAIILTGVGAILGGVTGIILTVLIGKMIEIPGVISLGEVFLVIVFALITGAGMGIIPAQIASRMNPVDAIRR